VEIKLVISKFFNQASEIIELCKSKSKRLTTIESCTGGLLSAVLTAVPGSSEIFDCGFVTYSNEAKNKLVKVPSKTIIKFGAVSDEVAIAMAQGGLHEAGADISVSITGVAGPGGGTAQKPVGLVHFGIATNWSDAQPNRIIFSGTRDEIRYQSVEHALKMVYKEVVDLP
jgi:nicotinamide-nucleotide amidase